MSLRWVYHLALARLPEACTLCGDPVRGARVCAGCRGDLPWLNRACERCGLPVDAAAMHRCDPLFAALDRVRAAFLYSYPIDRLIVRSKFSPSMPAAFTLGELLARPAARWVQPGDRPVLVPVPLHWRRLARRGFDQADEIVRVVATRLRLPSARSQLRRTRATASQSGLDAIARVANLRAAFEVRGNGLAGRSVLLVDDVLTTGATAAAAALALREAGARRVELWCVARVPSPDVEADVAGAVRPRRET